MHVHIYWHAHDVLIYIYGREIDSVVWLLQYNILYDAGGEGKCI